MGANTDIQDENGNTPMHIAAALFMGKRIEKLIARKANKDLKNKVPPKKNIFTLASLAFVSLTQNHADRTDCRRGVGKDTRMKKVIFLNPFQGRLY